jgi:hypothetical protein
MNRAINAIAAHWFKNDGATGEQILEVERLLRFVLPEDYKVFLRWSNGGEGNLGRDYLSLWPIEQVGQLNEDYQIDRYLPMVLAIGSDGGGECFALDYTTSATRPALIRVPFGDLDPDCCEVIGPTFREGLERLLTGQEREERV